MNKKAIIDLDILVYRIGSACDNWYYEYAGAEYESKKDLNQLLKEGGIDKESWPLLVEKKRKPESWESTRETAVKNLEDIIGNYPNFEGWISGSGNFRYQTATILPYKGNRDSTSRPTHYDALRQFFVDGYGAKISEGMEADDAIGLAHTPGKTVIVTLDKDLDCIPGSHFNWVNKEEYEVDELEANRNFYKQLLTGDPTDNILGLYGVGKGSAYVKKLWEMDDTREMNELMIKEYEARFGSYGRQFLKETGKLVWILQKRECPLEV